MLPPRYPTRIPENRIKQYRIIRFLLKLFPPYVIFEPVIMIVYEIYHTYPIISH